MRRRIVSGETPYSCATARSDSLFSTTRWMIIGQRSVGRPSLGGFGPGRRLPPIAGWLPAACVRNVLCACSHAGSVSSPSKPSTGSTCPLQHSILPPRTRLVPCAGYLGYLFEKARDCARKICLSHCYNEERVALARNIENR